MKKIFFLLVIVATGFGLVSLTTQTQSADAKTTPPDHHFEIPDNVQQVIDKSCFGCHNSESPNEKGVKKLQWDKLAELSTHKLIGKLTDIADVTANSDMPPEKFLAKKPEATPTAVEKKILVDWAESTAKALAK